MQPQRKINTGIERNITTDGFKIYKSAFDHGAVGTLVREVDKILQNSEFEYDFLKLNKDGHIHKVRYMFEKNENFIKALVSDAILDILQDIAVDIKTIVPTWEDMLIKVPYHGVPVGVHQDLALQSIGSDVHSLGIYLHSSQENPVYYLPESHKLGPLTKQEIHKLFQEKKSEFVPIIAKAGDIIVHNVKTVHYSEENSSSSLRYTWYLEFRTIKQLEEDSPWDEDWIHQRRKIWVHALQKYKPYEQIKHLIPDREFFENMPLTLRVSHTNEHIQYDNKNPYNHF